MLTTENCAGNCVFFQPLNLVPCPILIGLSHKCEVKVSYGYVDAVWLMIRSHLDTPLQHMETGLPPQIINFHCIFHDIKHPFMETPILQPSCRDISDNVQTHGVPWDADHCHRRGPTHFPRTWASSGASSKVIEFPLDNMVSINWGTPKLIKVDGFFHGQSYENMHDLGVALFWETPNMSNVGKTMP